MSFARLCAAVGAVVGCSHVEPCHGPGATPEEYAVYDVILPTIAAHNPGSDIDVRAAARPRIPPSSSPLRSQSGGEPVSTRISDIGSWELEPAPPVCLTHLRMPARSERRSHLRIGLSRVAFDAQH